MFFDSRFYPAKNGSIFQIMEVLKDSAGVLSNAEVLQVVREVRAKAKGRKERITNLATVTYEAEKYLQATPCGSQTVGDVGKFLAAMDQFKLTTAEKLELANLRPTSLCEMQYLLDDSEDR